MREGDTILRELVERAAEDPGAFRPFGALASARQYSMLYRMWRRHVPRGATVLDWGAGNGHFGHFLTRSGFDATAFTLSPESAMDWIGRPYTAVVLGAPAEPVRLPFPDDSFDAVASIGVLEHVRETAGNERDSLREIARVLRPGGTFVCYHFPNRWSWIDAVAGLVPGKHHHRYRFTRASIQELLRGAGLDLVEIRRYGVLPRNVLRFMPPRLRSSQAIADLWDALDSVLGTAAGPISQNYAFVARLPVFARNSER